jgi:aldehyde:ferredoxin oxidoreductase
MGAMDMRTLHDTVPEWVFYDESGRAPFTKGTTVMDREDINRAVTMYYEEMGWDKTTGAPTAQAYRKVGLGKVA